VCGLSGPVIDRLLDTGQSHELPVLELDRSRRADHALPRDRIELLTDGSDEIASSGATDEHAEVVGFEQLEQFAHRRVGEGGVRDAQRRMRGGTEEVEHLCFECLRR
jgi:hypothetical protein